MPRAVAALVALLGLWPSVAAAHPQYALSTVNRYSKLALLPRGQVRLSYTLMVGDVPALELRRQADRNGDGRLDEAEGKALALSLRERARAGLDVQLDGQPVRPAFEEPVLGLAGDAVAPAAFSVDLAALLPAPRGVEHELRYDDRTAIEPVGEVEILVEEGPGVRLLPPQAGARIEKKLLFYGPPRSSLSDRSLSVRFVEEAAPAKGRWPALAAALALVLVGGGMLLALRRRRASG